MLELIKNKEIKKIIGKSMICFDFWPAHEVPRGKYIEITRYFLKGAGKFSEQGKTVNAMEVPFFW